MSNFDLSAAVGASIELEWPVTEERTAHHLGNIGVRVLGTPTICHLIEITTCKAIEAWLPKDWVTVGTLLEVRHLKATPEGMTAWVKAKLRSVDRRRLVFDCEVRDELEKVAEGVHERFCMSRSEFDARVEEKRSRFAQAIGKR